MGQSQGRLEGLGMTRGVDASFWKGKRVLVTGHTGFKGSWLTIWLHRLGAEVTGISLAPHSTPNLFEAAEVAKICRHHICDVCAPGHFGPLILESQPEVVFHLAAQSLVREGYAEPARTFETNLMGSVYLLDALRSSDSVKSVVMVTTDKVYSNLESNWPYRESDRLGGHDPYSASKAASELVITSYRDAFLAARGVAVATARAGNVIGGGDWSADRLIPDAVRAWQVGQTLAIRRPEAVRPWQHVLEPVAAYMVLAQRLYHEPRLAGAYNFGPDSRDAASVAQVVNLAALSFGLCQEAWRLVGDPGPHETGWLALETAKARHALNILPRWSLSQAIEQTMCWYRDWYQGADARELCEQQIRAYEAQL
ncbi:CDP-glucose 4,6-dehydratase [Aeromonas dhakensis]|uniref:CDP-glucose 4,6-dehydratase n=1 Tax=Aeromonas dhakensis TaxID=196024 RepID=K1J8F7_9GAMM|nr:CDP-glucose 4,6-dehydratase [Aeromonas dhakensis]EKB26686.1 CDP-glucose 4,6-dehydratase [Aeromonas dhakensis]